MKNKKIKIICASGILCIAIVCIIFLCYFKSVVNKPLKDDKNVTITVNEGDGFSNIIEQLDKKNKLRNKYIVKLKIRMDYKKISLVPGSYEIKSNVSLRQLIKILETEDINKNLIKVTIPEGYNIEDMATVFEDAKLFSKDEFLKAVKEYKAPSYVKKDSRKKYILEGYLYPNTYYINEKETPEEVIKTMIDEFEKVIHEIEKEEDINIDNEKIEDVIIKASLIEKEVKETSEKSIVSSVIDNRLKKNMKLQFCSTVNYVIGYKGHEVLTYKDIEVDSPYNTYKYSGLPVGSIASPGKDSIIAALKPKDTEYLYFVLSEDNKTHYFSKTEEEHNAAKEKAEKARQ